MIRNWQPRVGQRVRLSRYGYAQLKLQTPEAFEASKDMIITSVENIGYDEEPIWAVNVNRPEIDMYLLDATMMEAI